MHFEAILWAALAMRMGGGYLNADQWHCWSNTQWKRVLKIAGTPPLQMLKGEDFSQCLAFHAGGTAKKWLADPGAATLLKQLAIAPVRSPIKSAAILPFVPFKLEKFRWLRKRASILQSMGYYKAIGAKPPV
jgi:hypothetical protein